MRLVKGPIFAQLVLADEINRAPPRTQAALLEAMAERQVTVTGQTLALDEPFMVVATQNPIEQAGTYPLPEAQLDRFMLSVSMDYPEKDAEKRIVAESSAGDEGGVEAVIDGEAIRGLAAVVDEMPIADHVVDYAVSLTRATRPSDATAPEMVRAYVEWGAGPRSAQALAAAAKAKAGLAGEPTPGCDHVREVARPVLRHRLVLGYTALGEGVGAEHVLEHLLRQVTEPTYDDV